MRVYIGGFGPRLIEKLHQPHRRAFAHVGDVLLVGHAHQQDLRPVQPAPRGVVHHLAQPRDHMGRHRGVDLARKLDEARGHAVFPRLPGEVERVDRDAVPAQTGAGIEWHEAEGLGGRRVDHLPDIDAHGVVDQLQLVDESDVDGAEDVLGDLHGLGRLRVGHTHDPVHHAGIEGLRRGRPPPPHGPRRSWESTASGTSRCPDPPARARSPGGSPDPGWGRGSPPWCRARWCFPAPRASRAAHVPQWCGSWPPRRTDPARAAR